MTRTEIFLYFLPLVAFMVLSTCQQEQRTAPVDQDREWVTTSLSADVLCYASMRAMQEGIDENKIDQLELPVFNEAGLMTGYILTINLTKVGDNQYTFTAQLKSQAESCVVHLVTNRNYGGSDPGRQYLGRKESDVLLSDLVAIAGASQKEGIPMWAHESYSEVKENSNLDEIRLPCSMAKLVLESHTTKLAGVSYTLCNGYDCSTVAPFKRTELPDLSEASSIDSRVPTMLGGTFLDNGNAGLSWYASGASIYGLERGNKVAKLIFCLVIRAKYDGTTDCSYCELGFVRSANRLEYYDFARSYWYKTTVQDALAIGAPTLNEALTGLTVNNLAFSGELQAYPSYSDGKGRLEVEASNYITTHGEQTLVFEANYYPEGSATVQNGKLQIAAVRNATDYSAIKGKGDVSIDNITGQIIATLQPTLTETSRISDITVGVTDDPNLMCIVRVEVGKPYSYELFQVNGQPAVDNMVTVNAHGQKGVFSFVTALPEDFRTQQLPMHLRFFTEYFCPDVTIEDGRMDKFSFGLAKDGINPVGRPCYMTIITKPSTDWTLKYTFLPNESTCAETIEMVSVENLFDTQRIIVKAN